MADDNHATQLQDLRSQIVTNLADMSGELASTDAIDLNTLLVIAHSTGRPDLLQAAHARIQKIADPSEKAERLLDLLDEVDYLLRERDEAADEPASEEPAPAEPAPAAAPTDDLTPDEVETRPAQPDAR